MFVEIIFYFLISFSLLYISIPLFRKIKIDKPISRSSHTYPVPTCGGIFIVLLSTIILFEKGFYFPIYCIPLAVVSLVDDISKNGVNIKFRLFTQILTIITLLVTQPLSKNALINMPIILSIPLFIFLIILGVSVINFTNFADGLDGLLAGTFSVIFLACAININPGFSAVFAILLGFLFINWSPANLFMGDVGSTFLGAIFFGIILNSTYIIDFSQAILMSIVILFDPFLTVLRRYFDKQNITKAHNLFIFQRLYRSGWSHSKISCLYIFLTTSIALTYLFSNLIATFIASFSAIYVLIYIEKRFAYPFKN